MCYAEFSAHYRLDSTCNYEECVNDNQPVILNEITMEENHEPCNLPYAVPLMSSKKEILKCRKVRKVLRYYTPNKHKQPEKHAHHLLMLFYPFRDEKNDLTSSDSFYA